MLRTFGATLSLLFLCLHASAQNVPPYDMWTDDVLAQIRDRSTLDPSLDVHITELYTDVFYTSNPSASFSVRWSK